MVLAAILLCTAAQAAPVERGGAVSAPGIQIDPGPRPVESRGPQRAPTGEKASGRVRFFNATKGYGFISRDDGLPDVFVHISAVERAGRVSLNVGDRIEFELEVDQRGKTSAVNLVPIQ